MNSIAPPGDVVSALKIALAVVDLDASTYPLPMTWWVVWRSREDPMPEAWDLFA
jgi:hypothetical protein